MGTTVTVIGSGYVGTVVAACFARFGNRVVAVEVDDRKLQSLKRGRAPSTRTASTIFSPEASVAVASPSRTTFALP
jgi:UDP-N-acetyl-D-mannosaminuronate dehydrogenase